MLPSHPVLQGARKPRQHTGNLFALTVPGLASLQVLSLFDLPLVIKPGVVECAPGGRALPKVGWGRFAAIAASAKALGDGLDDDAIACLVLEGVRHRAKYRPGTDEVVAVVLPSGDVVALDADGLLVYGRATGLGGRRFEWFTQSESTSAKDTLIAMTWLTGADKPPTELCRKASNWAAGTLMTF
jgi:hypothetical protein